MEKARSKKSKTSSRVTRRRFLKGTTAAIALPYFIPAGVLGNNLRAPANDRINLAVIGTGRRGKMHISTVIEQKGVQLVAVCDVMESRREMACKIAEDYYSNKQNNFKGCSAYSDFRDVLARDDIDAIMIVTQDHWHGPIAVAAARAGKDIFCEKPFGVSLADSKAIRDAVRQYGIVFQTGTQQRSEHRFRKVCELARSSYLGKIHTIETASPGPRYKSKYQGPWGPQPIPKELDYDMYIGPAPMKPYNQGRIDLPGWYLIWDYCVGFILNWGMHFLDIALWGHPEIAEETFDLTCKGTYHNNGLSDNLDSWQAEFTYPSGLRMTHTNNDNPNKEGCCFIGDKGWIRISREGIWAEPESLLKVNLKPNDTHLYQSKDHQEDFLKCVRTRRDPASPVESGHVATYLAIIAEIAARLNRKLTWNPKTELFINDDEANRRLIRPMREPWTL
ncbi:MAG: Gfo/Idh/MocA family protein [Planctomycetota bacterium]|jgi:predicted dehydrogenase